MMADATILFCDLVKFSRYSDSKQEELIVALNAEITHALYRDLFSVKDSENIISLPTGDGLALAFLEDSHSGSRWTETVFSLAHRLMQWVHHEERKPHLIQIRIGIHKGSVSIVSDFNRRRNVCGTTINQSQRIMNAAHPNQVLVSKDAYDRHIGETPGSHCCCPFSEETQARFEGPDSSPKDPHIIIAKHGIPISVYVMYQEGATEKDLWVRDPPDRLEYVKDKTERTRFIVRQLERLKHDGREIHIREQAAFSTFGIDTSEPFKEHVRWQDPKFFELRIEQKNLLAAISKYDHVRLSIMVDPARNPDERIQDARRAALVSWMKDHVDDENIRFVNGSFQGPNRLIIGDEICIEGYKAYDRGGYELSLVHYDDEIIKRAQNEFDVAFEANKKDKDKADVIKEIEEQCSRDETGTDSMEVVKTHLESVN